MLRKQVPLLQSPIENADWLHLPMAQLLGQAELIWHQ